MELLKMSKHSRLDNRKCQQAGVAQGPGQTPHRVQYFANPNDITGDPTKVPTITTAWGSGNLSDNTAWKNTKNIKTVQDYLTGIYGNNLKIGDKSLSDFKSVKDMQTALKNAGYTGISEDNNAGLQTMETLQDYFTRDAIKFPTVTQPDFQPLKPENIIPETTVDVPDVLNPVQNFTKAQIRQKMRATGLGAYDYSGAQRKALRKYFAGDKSSENIQAIQSMGLNNKQLTDLGLTNFPGQTKDQTNVTLNKQGGSLKMNVNYFQVGGAVKTSQQAGGQDIQEQVVQLVQAAMQGDEKSTQTIQKIVEAAKNGDAQAAQIAQLIQQVVKQMQGKATAAKYGSKLSYLHTLKTGCPEGYEVTYNKKGGKLCKECVKKQAAGDKLSKKPTGYLANRNDMTAQEKLAAFNQAHPYEDRSVELTPAERKTQDSLYINYRKEEAAKKAKKATKNYFGGKLYLN